KGLISRHSTSLRSNRAIFTSGKIAVNQFSSILGISFMGTESSQNDRAAFIEAARAAEADEDEKRWEARLKAVVKPPAKTKKKGKERVKR
ncbi:MAG: hypothetical protein JSR91_17130, partial [Proteobacteria bacterium]|nr:hypothetical protein [Pseudomonadota bacterium]